MADEFDDYLASLPDQITERLSEVVRDQAQRLSDAQKQALQALEQSPEETGHLEASCVVVPGENELEYLVQAGGDLTSDGTGDGSGKAYDHALAFEFGTSRQPARPFFYSTYNALKDDMQTEIDKAVSEILQ